MIYFDKLAFNIILQLRLNNINIDLKTNAVFNLLKIFYSYLVYCHRILLINFIKDTATSVKNLINCQ